MTDMSGRAPRPPSRGRRRTRSVLSTVLGTLLSAILLWWIYRSADGPALWRALHDLSPWSVLAAAVVSFLSIPLRSRQLRLLLARTPAVTPSLAVRAICLGNLVNSLVPARGGELVKAFLVSRWAGLALPRVLTALVIARVLDLGCILVLFGLMFAFLPLAGGISAAAGSTGEPLLHLPGGSLALAMIALGVAAALSVVILVVLSLTRVRFGEWAQARIARRSPAAARAWGKLWTPIQEALAVVQTTDHLPGAVALNLLCWLVFFMTPVPMLLALGMEWPDAMLATLGIVGLTTLAHLFPAAPTALGTYHATCLLGLALWCPEIERAQALAFTLVLHPVDTLATGLPGLFMVPGAWDDLRAAKKQRAGQPAARR